MAVLLAAISALAYGAGDFLGGLSARRMPAPLAAAGAQFTGLVLLVGVAALVGGSPGRTDWLWGMAAGVCVAVAVVSFYWAMAAGQMSVVAPVSALTAGLVPLVAGLVSGERPGPLSLAGAVLALGAIVLISREPRDPVADDERSAPPPPGRRFRVLGSALLSGLGFGGFLVLVSHTADGSGLWPLAGARATAVLLVGALSLVRRAGRPSCDGLRLAVGAGTFEALANSVFLVASRQGLLTLVGVIGSMYPASTVVLARVVLRERLAPHQWAGLALAVVAVVAVAVG